MNKDLIGAVEALEMEAGISKETMFDTIEKALREEYRAQYGNSKEEAQDCRVVVDRQTGDFHIFADRTVVEDSQLNSEHDYNDKEIKLSCALKIKEDAKPGDVVEVEFQSDGFTRTASKAAKNAIIQKIREEQKEALFKEYKDKEGNIITGVVQRIDDRGNILLDIGKTQTELRVDDQVPGETYQRGDRIRVVVSEVMVRDKRGTIIRVSRTSPLLVKRLFEEGVTEIQSGLVEIKSIAREAGSRTKMAVVSNDPDVDPVGACVGRNGERVKTIVNELGNEQIDVITWDENPAQLIVNALSPAKVVSIIADEDEKKAQLVVSDKQLSLAIGKAGQNVRLAAKLTGYGIDIKSESQAEEFSQEPEEEYGEEPENDVITDDSTYDEEPASADDVKVEYEDDIEDAVTEESAGEEPLEEADEEETGEEVSDASDDSDVSAKEQEEKEENE